MDLELLTKTIVEKLVTNKDQVSVIEKEENGEVIITISASEEDMGRIIGKSGKMINAIRTIVQASGYINDKKSVRVVVDTPVSE